MLVVANDTRGGVEPYAHLIRGMLSAGHSVRVAATGDYASMFRGVEAFVGLAGAGRAEIEAAASEKLSLRAMGALVSDRARVWARQTREVADGIDMVCSGIGGAMIAQPVAQSVSAPFVRTHLQPIDAPSTLYPGLLTPWLAPLGPLGNRLGHTASRAIMQTALRPPMKAARAELGLPRRQDPPHPTILYGFSGHVVPVKSDRSTRRVATGYWTGSPEDEYDNPGLEDFLRRPGPVVSIGFGSMRSDDPQVLRAVVIEAVQEAGVRAVLLSGWGAIADGATTRDDLFTVESVPHSWLFRRVSATVHHGGAGTTGAALLGGAPTVVVPFGAEQPFWAARTHHLGVSSPPIPVQRLTATRLATAMRTAIDTPSMQSRASAFATRIRAEDGVSAAIRELEIIGG
ncbi:MAG: glycosyltransferase [Microbacterium sp.]